MKTFRISLVSLVLCASTLATGIASELDLKSGDRVVLLGGTFFERMQAYGLSEAALAAGYPDRDITFRNLGWSGDNVFGEARAVFGTVEEGFQRLEKDVTAAAPTVVILNYGGNEAHAGTSGLANFQKGLNLLLDALAKTKARIVVALPHAYEELGGNLPAPEIYNQNLEIYRRTLRDAAARRDLPVIDLAAVIKSARTQLEPGQTLTDNGVHLSPSGYRAVASPLAVALGAKLGDWQVEFDVAKNVLEAVGCMVQMVEVVNRDSAPAGVTLTVKDDVLELSQQHGFGSPTTYSQGTLAVSGLADGDYELIIDGKLVRTATAAAWAKGISLVQRGGQEQAEQLRQAVVKKNQLYFHRYRPQNETYLFLFRKHEQGNNAVEIPQFDPLVEKQDQRIAALRRTSSRKFTLRRVAP